MPTFNFSGRRGAWLLGLCLVAAIAASVHLVAQEAAHFAASQTSSVSSGSLDALRERAEAGDGDATVALASSLLSRYERSNQRDELYEAALWVDRAWFSDDAPRHQLIDRLYGRYCGDKVMQWHWMCHNGE
jgi:hypothetical protein